MIPILYDESTTDFTTNGIGALADAISCKVTEERNGAFELSMVYPVSGIHFDEIRYSCQIKVDLVNSTQVFRIYSITKPMNGLVVIDAEHLSYQLSYIAVRPFSAQAAPAIPYPMMRCMNTCILILTAQTREPGTCP